MRTFALLAFALTALPASPAEVDARSELLRALQNPQSMEFFSLEPAEEFANSEGSCASHCFYGWAVLGHAATTSTRSRAVLQNELKAWLQAPEPDASSLCFNPRHGVRVVSGGHTYDFVVCFECDSMRVYKDSSAERFAHIEANRPQASWDRLLEELRIPLAKMDE